MPAQVDLEQENRTLREELRRARMEVHRVDQLQRDFIALAAHELRSPLAVLFGYAQILESETEGLARERAELVTTHAWRLKGIIDEILILQQIDAGELMVRSDTVEVAPAIRNAIDNWQSDATHKTLTIEMRADADLFVRADREKLDVVLHALLSNACKFTPAGGHIAVTAQSDASHVVLAVCDDGIGIAPEDQLHIFERFFQVGDPLTRRYKGLGLGLAIAQALVERMQGRIWVQSEPGHGTTLAVSLPVYVPIRVPALPGNTRPAWMIK
jgi:two-component system, sensor histidine kinase